MHKCTQAHTHVMVEPFVRRSRLLSILRLKNAMFEFQTISGIKPWMHFIRLHGTRFVHMSVCVRIECNGC